MTVSTALDRLAERIGIEPEYVSATRETVVTPPEVKRDLLTVMGFRAAGEQDAEAALRALDRNEVERPLPPVMVVKGSDRPLAVTLSLPAGSGPLQWVLNAEDGSVHRGEIAFAALPLRGSVTLDGRASGGTMQDCTTIERRGLEIAALPGYGYHRLTILQDGAELAAMTLIVAPERCYLPPVLAEHRWIWGVAAQLYLLRSPGNWGIGDFSDLDRLIGLSADVGASVVGLNPLHTLFPDRPELASPYSPSTRLFLNILNIDIAAIPEFAGDAEAQALVKAPDFRQALAAARAAPLVAYATVAQLKLPVLEKLHARFAKEAAPARIAAFAAFRRDRGEELERLACFQALREHLSAGAPERIDWRCWPEEYQTPDSPAVRAFAEAHRERIDFFAWTQWVADEQLARGARTAEHRGMAIGLYRDLAVGADTIGAETWSNPRVIAAAAHVGAPPDIFNTAGQDWGIPPFNPRALREEGYRSFIALVRANMRHAGSLRIDHAMALQHLYWIPAGRPPTQGAYVSYPLEDLVGILALESHRNRCIVVGEDLGTVPDGFRERMIDANILSYRVVFFEQDLDDGTFVPPETYPALSVATVGSHDLPTLRGWWAGRDIELRDRLHLYPDPAEAARQRDRRACDRRQLLAALTAAGLHPETGPEMTDDALSDAVHAFLARSAAMVAMVQLDDLADEPDQVNLPGTSDQYPNWRRKLSLPLEALFYRPRAQQIAAILRAARPLTRPEETVDKPARSEFGR